MDLEDPFDAKSSYLFIFEIFNPSKLSEETISTISESKLKLKITEITRMGEVTVKILMPNNKDDKKEIIKRVNNFTIRANVICENNNG